MIKAVIVDVAQTFEGPVVFLGCEQKMMRSDKKDAKSPMVPDYGKWSVALMVRVKGDDGKVARENINVTMESSTQPCQGIEEFDKVNLEGLQYNMMANDRGQAMAFWRVKGIKQMGVAAGNAAASGQVAQPR